MSNIALCDNGNIALCDNGNILLCAPCECPCENWPEEDPENPGYADPAGFPCGGLEYEYAVANALTSPVDGTMVFYYEDMGGGDYSEARLTENASVKARKDSCRWRAHDTPMLGRNSFSNYEWVEYEGDINTRILNCKWQTLGESLEGGTPSGYKEVGMAPPGIYTGTGTIGGGVSAQIKFDVTEAAP